MNWRERYKGVETNKRIEEEEEKGENESEGRETVEEEAGGNEG
jgi:hypothetical protein